MPQIQYFGTVGPSRRQLQKEMLGESIGKGLSNFLNNYSANQALEGVERDPSYKNASVSERASRLERALSPFGEEVGGTILQRRIGIEQQRAKEQEEVKNQRIQSNLYRMLSGEQLSPEEASELPSQFQIAAHKAMQPKAPPGGVSAQPVPPEVSQSIGNILGGSKGLTADQLAQRFDEAGVPRAFSNSYIENRRREDEARAKTSEGKEKAFFKLNEPKLIQLADDQRNLKLEDMRFGRMEELLKNPERFPSAFTASLFSREGQLNPIASSQLTPEAQEFVKLIVDSTSNIKDSYGARVTNFDLQTYLKKLPGLLNTPEGKQRILRDLRSINEINRMHNQGIQEVFEEAGGSDKIPYSEAEQRFQKKYGKEIDRLSNNFITPEKASFNELPDAQKYLGRKIKNPETGEIFISDGNEWKPFKG